MNTVVSSRLLFLKSEKLIFSSCHYIGLSKLPVSRRDWPRLGSPSVLLAPQSESFLWRNPSHTYPTQAEQRNRFINGSPLRSSEVAGTPQRSPSKLWTPSGLSSHWQNAVTTSDLSRVGYGRMGDAYMFVHFRSSCFECWCVTRSTVAAKLSSAARILPPHHPTIRFYYIETLMIRVRHPRRLSSGQEDQELFSSTIRARSVFEFRLQGSLIHIIAQTSSDNPISRYFLNGLVIFRRKWPPNPTFE